MKSSASDTEYDQKCHRNTKKLYFWQNTIHCHAPQCNQLQDENGFIEKYYNGLDIKAIPGITELKAILDGEIVDRGSTSDTEGAGYRLYLKATVKDGTIKYYGYCHLSEIKVQEGDKVSKGKVIAIAGKSGNASKQSVTWKHCHLIVYDSDFITELNHINFIKTKF